MQYGLYRERYIRYISKKIPELPEFFSLYGVEIIYHGEWIYSENPENFIKNYLKENRQRDIFSGHTHIGPHRDDFSLIIKNPEKNFKNFSYFDLDEEKIVQNFLSR